MKAGQASRRLSCDQFGSAAKVLGVNSGAGGGASGVIGGFVGGVTVGSWGATGGLVGAVVQAASASSTEASKLVRINDMGNEEYVAIIG